MTRDPDNDLEARRLELQLAESSLLEHRTAVAAAGTLLDAGTEAMQEVPAPKDPVARLLFAQAAGAVGGAVVQLVQTRMMLDDAQRALEHARAHLEHREAEEAKTQHMQHSAQEFVSGLIERMREQGVDVQPIQGPGGAIAFGFAPREDDET